MLFVTEAKEISPGCMAFSFDGMCLSLQNYSVEELWKMYRLAKELGINNQEDLARFGEKKLLEMIRQAP